MKDQDQYYCYVIDVFLLLVVIIFTNDDFKSMVFFLTLVNKRVYKRSLTRYVNVECDVV